MSESIRFGNHELIELIGRGGMGEVWRARNTALGRPVAVKLIRPDRLSGVEPELKRQVLKRFEREIRATTARVQGYVLNPTQMFFHMNQVWVTQ